MNERELGQIRAFFARTDREGVSNLEKAESRQRVIRRVATTDKDRSYEAAGAENRDRTLPPGVVVEEGKLIGFGIHIFNEDVYPLQSFEIYLRGCGLTGELDLSGCRDLVFVDLYHNEISAVGTFDLPALRILGLQDNRICALDPTQMPACQGIDVGKNRLRALDVSQNPELVELYVNDNFLTEVDLRRNARLKYFYCQNNRLTELDTTANPLLRHMDATGNPLRRIRSLAPQREGRLPLELTAGAGGFVGLKFNPVYTAQWKETGEWQQAYYAMPEEGWQFDGWYDEGGTLLDTRAVWPDTYGESRRLYARFRRI